MYLHKIIKRGGIGERNERVKKGDMSHLRGVDECTTSNLPFKKGGIIKKMYEPLSQDIWHITTMHDYTTSRGHEKKGEHFSSVNHDLMKRAIRQKRTHLVYLKQCSFSQIFQNLMERYTLWL